MKKRLIMFTLVLVMIVFSIGSTVFGATKSTISSSEICIEGYGLGVPNPFPNRRPR